MKKFSRIFSVMGALAILLACTAVALAAEKSQKPGSQNPPALAKMDLRVERVFISEADKPGVPFTSALSDGGNYVLNCEMSYSVPGSVAGSTPIVVRVWNTVDGQEVGKAGPGVALSPNVKKNTPVDPTPQGKTLAFSAGSHTYECGTGILEGESDSSNNKKSMTYTVNKILKPFTGTMQKK
jgi:hypothetical protein